MRYEPLMRFAVQVFLSVFLLFAPISIDAQEMSEIMQPSRAEKETLDILDRDPRKESEENSPVDEPIASAIQEYRPTYFISGKPDTKIQFSFKFLVLEEVPLYFGYTQTMFWELAQKKSSPFSELNYNPELFYQLKLSHHSYFGYLNGGYGHVSNGKDGPESRSVDTVFVDFLGAKKTHTLESYFLLRIKYLFNEDEFNKDLVDYDGLINLKVYLNKIAERLLNSEELYIEYYNGGKFAERFDRSSYRISIRAKPWSPKSRVKLFFQYFNGFTENLSKYNQQEETYRLGLSIGGP